MIYEWALIACGKSLSACTDSYPNCKHLDSHRNRRRIVTRRILRMPPISAFYIAPPLHTVVQGNRVRGRGEDDGAR
jgi:hypothetical protein